MKGLPVSIYRDSYKNDLNKFNTCKEVTLVGKNITPIFEDSEKAPAVKIVTRNLFGSDYTHAESVEPGSYAFGGSFIYSSDSRFPSKYPIPLHDRQMNLEH